MGINTSNPTQLRNTIKLIPEEAPGANFGLRLNFPRQALEPLLDRIDPVAESLKIHNGLVHGFSFPNSPRRSA